MAKKNEYDTGCLPPGDDIGDAAANRGQSLNTGYGATKADLNRGYLSVPEPDSSRDLDKYSEPKGGFLRRSPFPFER